MTKDSFIFGRNITLKSLPFHYTSPDISDVKQMFDRDMDVGAAEVSMSSDKRDLKPELILSQIDPMPYATSIREIAKLHQINQVKTDFTDDPKGLEKYKNYMDRKMNGMMHTNNGEYA